MKHRDAAAAGCALATLAGVWGQFGPWWALILGGIGGLVVLILLTLEALRKPDGA